MVGGELCKRRQPVACSLVQHGSARRVWSEQVSRHAFHPTSWLNMFDVESSLRS
jgi:hypothetical protein